MSKILLSIFFVLSIFLSKAQIPNFQWGNVIAPNYFSTPFGVAHDSHKNTYVCGFFTGPTVDFDPGPGSFTLSAGSGGKKDVFISKMDSTGKFIWAKRMGGTGDDWGWGIQVDDHDNIYIAGTFQMNADFDPGPGTAILSTPQNTTSTFVSKLDHSGSFLWVKGIDNVAFSGFDVDRHGNIVMIGSYRGTTDFDPGPGVYNLTSNTGINSMYILKLNSIGNLVSAFSSDDATTQGYMSPRQIKKDSLGNVYVVGICAGTIDFDPGPAVSTQTVIGNTATSILKLDSMNNFQWARIFGSVNGSYQGQASLDIDKFGNVYMTGDFHGTVDYDPGIAVYNLTPFGTGNAFVLKLNSFGNFVWVKQLGGNGGCYGSFIKLDAIGDINIVGFFTANADFDPGPALNTLSTTGFGDEDGFIVKLNNSGNFIWAGKIEGSGSERCLAITIDKKNNNMFVLGTGGGGGNVNSMDLDPTAGVLNTGLLWDKAPFVVRIGPCPSSISSISGPTSLCIGGGSNYSVALSTGATGYIWDTNSGSSVISGQNTNSVNIGFGSATSASIVVTPTNTCGAGNSGTLTVSLSLSPTVTAICNPTVVCPNSNLVLSASGASTYIWSTGSTSQTVNINASATSVYTVTGYNGPNCFNTATVSALVHPSPVISVNSGTICSGQTFTMNPSGAMSYTLSSGSATVSPTTSSTYTITGTNSNGCTGTATSSVTVNPVPAITVNSGSVCPGRTFTIVPSGAVTYSYSSGSNTVIPSANSTYTVTGTGANGCINSIGAVSSVSISAVVPVITVNSGTICSNQTFTIVPSGATTYTYSNGSNTVSPSVNSSYTVTGTDVNGCVNSVGAISSVSVNAAPSLTATQNVSVCVGTSTALNISGANTYSWTTGATTSSISVSPTITTSYSVTGTGLNNCSSTQTVAVTVNPNCQDVWPGDANSDGTADNFDVLELGLHFTQTGPARATTNNSWQSYFANNWTGTISNGKNVNHSDCNGDGTIDGNDTLAIYNNYGLTHTFKPAEPIAVNPQLSIVPDQSAVAKGNWGSASVFLGESSAPVTNINGLAFTVNFDQNLIDANSFYIEYPTSFLNVGNQNLKFQKPDFSNGKLYTAITHTITNNVSGNGKIAILHYKIKSALTTDEVFNIGISQTKQSDASGTLTPLTAGAATIAAIGASVGMDEFDHMNTIGVYPNPANTSATIQSSNLLQKAEILSLTGQVISIETISGNQHQLDLSNIANGVYFINVYSGDQKIARKKLIVQH